MPPLHMDAGLVPAAPLLIQLPANGLGKQRKMAQVLHDPASAVAAIWGMKQWVEDLPPSLSVTLTVK